MLRNLKTAALALAVTLGTSGAAMAQNWHYDRGDYGYGYGREGMRSARDFGFQDGSQVGRDDIAHRKPFNPYPRGRYSHADHGYRHEFGDRRDYMAQYSRAYEQGYRQMFRRF